MRSLRAWVLLSSLVALRLVACSDSTDGEPQTSGGAKGTGAGGRAAQGGSANSSDGGVANEAGAASGGAATAGADSGEGGESGAGGGDLPPSLIDAIAVVESGGEADLDGDGVPDLVTEVASDRRVSRIVSGGVVLLEVTRKNDGTTDKVGDFDLDGKSDYAEREETTDARFTRVTEQDTNYDAVVDFRETYEIDIALGTTHTLTQSLQSGAWVTLADATNSTGAIYAGDPCTSDYPAEDDVHTKEVTILGHVRVVQCLAENSTGCVTSVTKGACTRAEVERIRSEMSTLFRDGIDELKPVQDVGIADSSVVECLSRRQPPFIEAFISNIATGSVVGGKPKHVFDGARIACGVDCNDGTLGETHPTRRSEVNLNLQQPNHELRDTLLHELIHAAGYEGPPGHNDGGSQDDSVYACSRWCTGHSLRSPGQNGKPVYDPNGELDMNDCFRCSGTSATKKECCGDGYACIGGCCADPCGPDGTCLIDPCNPAKNRGDFSGCRFKGQSDLISGDADCNSLLEWHFGSVSGGKVSLTVSGNTSCTMPTEGCSVTPLAGISVKPTDGAITLDYSKGAPTYTGFGVTTWPITIACPDAPVQTSTLGSPWLSQSTPLAFDAGGPLTGSFSDEGSVITWTFRPY